MENQQPLNEILWITLINKGYINFTKNFLLSIKKLNLNFKLTIFCIDDESFEVFKNNETCNCYKAESFLSKKLSIELEHFGEYNYKKIVFSKLDAILYSLKQNPNKYIGYIDTDIVLFSDPSSFILDLFSKNKSTDIITQCDEMFSCTNSLNCKSICSGVIVFKNKETLFDMFRYSENDIQTFSGDQDFLLDQIKKRSVSYLTLNQKLFVNGTYLNLYNPFTKISKNVILVHFNWLVGNRKIWIMKLNNLWFLTERRTFFYFFEKLIYLLYSLKRYLILSKIKIKKLVFSKPITHSVNKGL